MTSRADSRAGAEVKCDRCDYTGPQATFPQKKNLTYNKSCFTCKEKQSQYRATKRSTKGDTNAAEDSTSRARRAPPVQPIQGYTTLEWSDCAALVEAHKNDAFELETFVAMTGESAKSTFRQVQSGKEVAAQVAKLLWDITGYRFIYKLAKRSSASDSVASYSYYCAQNEAEVKKSQVNNDPQKRRARMKMCRFPCKGTLQITSHLHYVNISINAEIKEFVEQHKEDSAANIWTRVLAQNPQTEVTQKQIYALWSELNEGEWRLDDDQVKSAQMILKKLEGVEVEIIPIRSEAGIHAIAFTFKEVLDDWASMTEELAMDSTWKTNAAQYKLYGFVAEAKGQAMPFAFLFIVSSGDAADGAKLFTLSDKEPAEITACRTKIEKAKHQLCYWHAITYIEERLAENKPPAAYDPRKAHRIFDFIDPTWAPGVSAVYPDDNEEGEGVLDEEEPGTQLPKPSQTCVPPIFVIKHGDARHPVWPNPPKIRKTALPDFCPKEFRSEIIEMFRTHLHQHPRIPQNNLEEPYLSAEEIHRRAVKHMYDFCYANELSQVWAYMWNRWYTPKQWPLWARDSCDAIPCLKTTMIVESLWRHVKHRDLAQFNRPRLDLVVNIVFKSLLSRVKHTLDYIHGIRRMGRPRALAGWQVDAKALWADKSWLDKHRHVAQELQIRRSAPNTKGRAERLQLLAENEDREPGTYATDIDNWPSDDKPLTDLRFFLDLHRNHFPPYYSIPGIHTDRPDIDESTQPKEVLVLGIRGVASPAREERHEERRELARREAGPGPVSVASGGGEDTASSDNSPSDGAVAAGTSAASDDDDEEQKESDRDVRVPFSEARIIYLKRCWEEMMGVIENPRGVHPKMAAVLEGTFSKVERIGGDIGRDKQRRKNPRTWDDNNSNTMYLD
ncbi:hypothetical protein DFH06DRAFT_1328467 [Mycena polygramma]|nr:hypothetical protein DFH06DRAFT_1328467 [Mycena polygramma]